MSAPKLARWLARWLANDFAIAAAVRAASGVASGAMSAESAAQHPGSIRLASGHWTGSVRADAGECPAQCPQPRPVHDQSAVSPQPCPQPVRGRAISAQHPAWRPTQHPRNFRATSETCPGSWREASHKTPMKVRAKVCTIVGTMVRK